MDTHTSLHICTVYRVINFTKEIIQSHNNKTERKMGDMSVLAAFHIVCCILRPPFCLYRCQVTYHRPLLHTDTDTDTDTAISILLHPFTPNKLDTCLLVC